MTGLKMIARFRDGKMAKGTSLNFHPDGAAFHLIPVEAAPGTPPAEISLNDIKAIFFVETFEGKRNYEERKTLSPQDHPQGRVMQVAFKDGEVMVGSVLQYSANAPGFFLFPIDAHSNNRKVFVVNSAVAQTTYL